MTRMTLDELITLLRECAGADESVNMTGDIADIGFDDLGYDSLALFNTVGRIERDYRVQLDDDVVSQMRTPAQLVTLVNDALAGAG
jgi:act minimal PKS acyl carrier protein